MNINNLPAVDDENLRREQSEKFANGMHNLGEMANEMRKHQRIATITNSIFYLIVITLVGSALVYAVYSEGFEGIVDTDALSRRIDCNSESFNDTVRTYADANEFVKLTSGTCKLRGE